MKDGCMVLGHRQPWRLSSLAWGVSKSSPRRVQLNRGQVVGGQPHEVL
jgi:hypothetical protein